MAKRFLYVSPSYVWPTRRIVPAAILVAIGVCVVGAALGAVSPSVPRLGAVLFAYPLGIATWIRVFHGRWVTFEGTGVFLLAYGTTTVALALSIFPGRLSTLELPFVICAVWTFMFFPTLLFGYSCRPFATGGEGFQRSARATFAQVASTI